jgi:hypothetical protein
MIRSRMTVVLATGIVVGVLTALIPSASAFAHSPTRSPLPRFYFSMANDDATGQVVLFGGRAQEGAKLLGDTWTWDGTSWAKRMPAHSPSPRDYAAIAYDGATKQLVLFGGSNGGTSYNDTWTWDGSDWTQLHPAHSPPLGGFMVYDAALSELVLFNRDEQWIWSGTDWTEESGGYGYYVPGSIAYDPATKEVIGFGGYDDEDYDDWTFMWDGTGWTFLDPAHAPKQRAGSAMAYDPAMGRVLLWGGRSYHDTWTWTGTDWKRLNPAHYPVFGCGEMASDPANGQVVLFSCSGSTWTWSHSDWHQHLSGSARVVTPRQGPPGVTVTIQIWGFLAGEEVRISFVDSAHVSTVINEVPANGNGWVYPLGITIPGSAASGKGFIVVEGETSHQTAKARFNVT